MCDENEHWGEVDLGITAGLGTVTVTGTIGLAVLLSGQSDMGDAGMGPILVLAGAVDAVPALLHGLSAASGYRNAAKCRRALDPEVSLDPVDSHGAGAESSDGQEVAPEEAEREWRSP